MDSNKCDNKMKSNTKILESNKKQRKSKKRIMRNLNRLDDKKFNDRKMKEITNEKKSKNLKMIKRKLKSKKKQQRQQQKQN